MSIILLTKGKAAVVDSQDFYWLNQWNWYAQDNGGGKFYAARDSRKPGHRKIILMHREILGALGSLDGEHRDGDSLNNRRYNLRPATRTQNHANRLVLPKNKSCKYRGVYYMKRANRWTAQISVENKKKHLGCFTSPIDAAKAYDIAAKILFGEFARPNFR